MMQLYSVTLKKGEIVPNRWWNERRKKKSRKTMEKKKRT